MIPQSQSGSLCHKGDESRAWADELSYVQMSAEDVEAVSQLERLSFSSPWPTKSFEMVTVTPHVISLVAKDAGELAGYCIAIARRGQALIANLAVGEEYRRRGVAARLLREVIIGCKEAGATFAILDVRESNQGAQKLYYRFGFRPVGCRRDYYSDPLEDSLVMYRRI